MKEPSRSKNKKSESSRYRWALTAFLLAVGMSALLSFASESVLSQAGLILALLILVLFIVLGIVFDIIGVAVTAADPKPFHSMAAHREKGAKEALSLLRNADRVSSVCNDVVGDICGIVSGATGAVIVARLQSGLNFQSVWISVGVTALVSGLTIGGKAIGKPFVVLVNSAQPDSAEATEIAESLSRKYDAKCLPVNCLRLSEGEIQEIIQSLLYEFPLQELDVFFPSWVEVLPEEHPIKKAMVELVAREGGRLTHMRQMDAVARELEQSDMIECVKLRQMDLGLGCAALQMDPPRALFYETVGKETGFTVQDDGDLMDLLTDLSKVRREYDKVAPALRAAYSTGYGIVTPELGELKLEDPEIVRQGGRYSLKMKASAPSIHMIRADIATTVSPIVGDEKQSEDMVNYLLQQYQGDKQKLWQSNIFGRSFNEIVGDDLQAKLKRMPEPSQKKMREALERIINEGSGGLICIIL